MIISNFCTLTDTFQFINRRSIRMTEKEFKITVLPLSSLVYPMAKRLLKTEDAACEAVQLTMVKLWDSRLKLKECNNIKAFVFKVTRNTCLDELKRKKADSFDETGQSFISAASYQLEYDDVEAVALVRKIVEELPDGQRDVLQMRDIDGLEFPEIAEILATDIAYVRVLLSRARKRVKEKLEKIYAYEAVQQK